MTGGIVVTIVVFMVPKHDITIASNSIIVSDDKLYVSEGESNMYNVRFSRAIHHINYALTQ